MFSPNCRRPVQIYFVGIVNNLPIVKMCLRYYRHRPIFHQIGLQTICNLRTPTMFIKNKNKLLVCSSTYLLNNHNYQTQGDRGKSRFNRESGFNRSVPNENSPLTVFNEERNLQEELISTEIAKNKPLSVHQWDKLRFLTLEGGTIVNDNNIDGLIMNICIRKSSFYTGKSYLEYMNVTSKKLNLATIGNYMKLCYISRTLCKPEDIRTIEMLYMENIIKYPVLDANSAENVILGISITKHWTDYSKYLDMIAISCSPSIRTYCAVIEAAFLNKEDEIGWKLLKELGENGKTPLDSIFEVWLNIVKQEKNVTYFEKMLNYFADYDLKPSKQIASKVKQVFDSINKSKSKGVFTSVTNRGVCKNCQRNLEIANVSNTEFKQLKTAFLNPVLVGRDIFIKTKPEELAEYQKLLETTAPYDVVLDGLNIAYSSGTKNKTPSTWSFMVKSVVAHFLNQSKKVLVLGRKHMNRWPENNMKFIRDHATMFLADDLSHDDPFLLYATLYSGPKTDFVSRDLMRGHKFLLKEPALKSIFFRWQTQHQIFLMHVGNDGRIICKLPISFRQSAQQNEHGSWHIPYQDEDDDQNGQSFSPARSFKTFTPQQGWVCLR